MGAYSFGAGASSPVDIDSLLESNEIGVSYEESSVDAAARVVAETTANWNAIVEACAIDELNYLEENGVEMVYEGATLDGFFAKAKEFFLNIWKKIQEIFKKVLIQLNSWSKTDKDFIKKYEKDLNRAANNGLGDKEVKFFDYDYYKNGADIAATTNFDPQQYKGSDFVSLVKDLGHDVGALSSADDWKEANKKLSEADSKAAILDTYRGEVVYEDGSKKVEAGEFVKALKEKIQGSDSPDDVKISEVLSKCISFLGISDKIKTNLNKALNQEKKGIDNAIKALETVKKSLNKELGKETGHEIEGAQHSMAVTYIDILKSEKNIITTATGVALNCLKSCSRQSKAVCVAALTYKAPKNESGMLQSENEGSLLDRVVLR